MKNRVLYVQKLIKFEAVDNMKDYLENNKEILQEYINIRTSDSYQDEYLNKMKQLLLEFNKSSGYYSVFISNLKVLSPSYCRYTEKLEEANKIFLEKYPQIEHLKD